MVFLGLTLSPLALKNSQESCLQSTLRHFAANVPHIVIDALMPLHLSIMWIMEHAIDIVSYKFCLTELYYLKYTGS